MECLLGVFLMFMERTMPVCHQLVPLVLVVPVVAVPVVVVVPALVALVRVLLVPVPVPVALANVDTEDKNPAWIGSTQLWHS